MVRISKQNRKRNQSPRKPKQSFLREKTGSMNSFPEGGFKKLVNALDSVEGQVLSFVSKTNI